MRLLITGGAGFIGSNLVERALHRGHYVTVLDDLSTGHSVNLEGLDASFVLGSVTDPEAVDRAMQGAEAVIHLGALGSVPRSVERPMDSHVANATGTLVVLEAARRHGVAHLSSASSSSVYGANPSLPKQERHWVRPLSPYAVSKLAAEQYTLCYQSSYGLPTLAFRLFNVYGPRQRAVSPYAAVIPILIDRLLRGQPLPVNGDGSNSRDFTYVASVCQILLDAAERRVTHPEPVNLAFGTSTSILDLITALAREVDGRSVIDFRPERQGDVAHSQADSTLLRRLFPSAQPVPLQRGLKETVDWFRATEGVDAASLAFAF